MVSAEAARDADPAGARRGRAVAPESGKTRLSIPVDKKVVDYSCEAADEAGGGSCQTMIHDALVAHVAQRSMLTAVRQIAREELATPRAETPRSVDEAALMPNRLQQRAFDPRVRPLPRALVGVDRR